MDTENHSWKQILDSAEKEADAIARELPSGLEMKPCRRCKGTGVYTFVTGAKGECASCMGGSIYADKSAWLAFLQDREIRRLRVLWAAQRTVLRCYGVPASIREEAQRFMSTIERRARMVNADPRVIA